MLKAASCCDSSTPTGGDRTTAGGSGAQCQTVTHWRVVICHSQLTGTGPCPISPRLIQGHLPRPQHLFSVMVKSCFSLSPCTSLVSQGPAIRDPLLPILASLEATWCAASHSDSCGPEGQGCDFCAGRPPCLSPRWWPGAHPGGWGKTLMRFRPPTPETLLPFVRRPSLGNPAPPACVLVAVFVSALHFKMKPC